MANDRATWRGLRGIVGGAALLFGIMLAVSAGIAVLAFLVLVLVHVVFG
jgi:hypothetical protein